ncbi:MAG: dihydrofolate reductase, partial [Leptolyngbya sp. SIO3F4]|nr:dihydrofolate reductase [Leptolyngbya sp. SIO3F4]
VGGGQLNTLLLNAGLIDTLILSIHPIVLGKGIRLFEGEPLETQFKLTQSEVFDSGLVQVEYRKKEQ